MRKLARRCAPRLATRDADAELAWALTQLLIDGGYGDAVGCIVVATWRCRQEVFFEVICPERVRSSVAPVLARVLARPFYQVGAWLLSRADALQLIARANAAHASDPAY